MATNKERALSGLERLENHDLIENLIDTKPGDHICVLYEYSPIEQIETVTSFIREGLEQGDQCVYVADEMPIEHLEQWFKVGGIDVAAQKQSGGLVIWTRDQWRQPGVLDTIRKAAQVREIVEAAFGAGFSGVRFAVEMTWTLRPDTEAAAVEAWESYSNQLLNPSAPVRAMCLYGRKRLPRATVEAGLRTHPIVIDGSGLRANERFERSNR